MWHERSGYLDGFISSMILDSLFRKGKLALGNARDRVGEAVSEEVESACRGDIGRIISEYESWAWKQPGVSDYLEGDEETYSAHEWEKARERYAEMLAAMALEIGLGETLDEMEDLACELIELAHDMGHDANEWDLWVGQQCYYGWVPHTRETADGTRVWSDRQLDGLNGIAGCVHLGDNEIWLGVAWDPDKDEDTERGIGYVPSLPERY